jgi:hypothetical protein
LEDLLLLQTTSPLLLVNTNNTNTRCLHKDRLAALRDSLKWINVQATLLDICIAFYPVGLPSYVILEIVDRFPFWSTHVKRKKKIDYIIQIKRFCDDLIEKR